MSIVEHSCRTQLSNTVVEHSLMRPYLSANPRNQSRVVSSPAKLMHSNPDGSGKKVFRIQVDSDQIDVTLKALKARTPSVFKIKQISRLIWM
jgi:hypothetical protein